MRRFITSLSGRVISNLVVLALVLPSLSLALSAKATAQVATLPSWAVVEFENKVSPGTNFGKVAAEAVGSELLKTGNYEIVSQETVDRAAKALGIALPPAGSTNLFRLADEVRTGTIVSGEIAAYKVYNSGNGKYARVTIRTVVNDVVSQTPVNGAVITADSTVRPGGVEDSTLITDAIQAAARNAVREVQSKALPVGTVLNTTTDNALINKGARSGFREGQEVVIIRGREQVAAGRIGSVEPDSSTVKVERPVKGVQPGDKVRAIFSVPPLVIKADGTASEAKPKPQISSALITTLLIVGLVVLLLSNGGGSDQQVVGGVTSEATLDEAFQPAVRVSWTPNGFAKGNSQRVQWQVWRSDVFDTPVATTVGIQTSLLDRVDLRTVSYTRYNQVGGITCTNTSYNGQNQGNVPGVRAGRPYVYSVELVYALNSLDLPDGGSSGSGSGGSNTGLNNSGGNNGLNNSGGNTGGNNNTGGNGGNTGGNGTSQTCYFMSERSTARGQATPLNRPTLVSPAEAQPVSSSIQFQFNSAVQTTPILVEYVIQFSDTINFTKSRTVTMPAFTKTQTGVVTSPLPIDTARGDGIPGFIRSASTVFWRVGAKNPEDRPGPLPDPQTGQRYIFSQPRSFTRPGGGTPPPP